MCRNKLEYLFVVSFKIVNVNNICKTLFVKNLNSGSYVDTFSFQSEYVFQKNSLLTDFIINVSYAKL